MTMKLIYKIQNTTKYGILLHEWGGGGGEEEGEEEDDTLVPKRVGVVFYYISISAFFWLTYWAVQHFAWRKMQSV